MAFTHSFTQVTPPARFDGVSWATVQVQESAGSSGPWTQIASLAIPVDASPNIPNPVDITVTTATLERGFFRFRFTDAALSTSPWTSAVYSPSIGFITVEQMRARYPELTVVKYPDPVVVEAIDLATEAFEHEADVAFTSRTTTLTLDSTGSRSLSIPIARVTGVTAASSTTGTIDVTKTRVLAGSYLTGASWPTGDNVTVTVTHGYPAAPLRVIRAVMLLARTWLVRGPVDDRATQIPSAEGGTINLATPGLYGSWSGIPEVDGALDEYRHHAYAL